MSESGEMGSADEFTPVPLEQCKLKAPYRLISVYNINK